MADLSTDTTPSEGETSWGVSFLRSILLQFLSMVFGYFAISTLVPISSQDDNDDSVALAPEEDPSSSSGTDDTDLQQVQKVRSVDGLMVLSVPPSLVEEVVSARLPRFVNLFEEAASNNGLTTSDLKRIATYKLPGDTGCFLSIVQGDITDFFSDTGAIVCAGNEGGISGKGVDWAINEAGGEELLQARLSLPMIGMDGVRCPTGDVKPLGPDTFGELGAPYIFVCAGPNYTDAAPENIEWLDTQLSRVYTKSLAEATMARLTQVCFPLISTGAFKGKESSKRIIMASISTIQSWCSNENLTTTIDDIVVVAHRWKDAKKLITVCDEVCAGCLKVSVA